MHGHTFMAEFGSEREKEESSYRDRRSSKVKNTLYSRIQGQTSSYVSVSSSKSDSRAVLYTVIIVSRPLND